MLLSAFHFDWIVKKGLICSCVPLGQFQFSTPLAQAALCRGMIPVKSQPHLIYHVPINPKLCCQMKNPEHILLARSIGHISFTTPHLRIQYVRKLS